MIFSLIQLEILSIFTAHRELLSNKNFKIKKYIIENCWEHAGRNVREIWDENWSKLGDDRKRQLGFEK